MVKCYIFCDLAAESMLRARWVGGGFYHNIEILPPAGPSSFKVNKQD